MNASYFPISGILIDYNNNSYYYINIDSNSETDNNDISKVIKAI